MDKTIINTAIVIVVVILIIIATTIIFKPKAMVKENKYEYVTKKYEEVIISLMQTKKIGVYTKGDVIVQNIETKAEKEYKQGIINNITDYEEVDYFINLIKDCPLITHEIISASVSPNERLYMYDENDNELLWIEINKDHTIDIQKDKTTYYLQNKYFTKINEFLKKYINYEF